MVTVCTRDWGLLAADRYEKTVEKLDQELDELRRALFVESKAHPSAKVRKKNLNIRKNIASREDLHESPNHVTIPQP